MTQNIYNSASEYLAKFEVNNRDLLSFCDCLSLIRNNIGLIAWGAEDFFTLFEKGTTSFYTATEKDPASAVKSLKQKVQILGTVDYAFFILVSPNEQIREKAIDETLANVSQLVASNAFWYQIYPRETVSVTPPIMSVHKKLSYDEKEIATFCASTTVYLLTNKR